MKLRFSINQWLWVFYPIAVVMFMVYGVNYMLSSGQSSLAKITVNQNEVEARKLKAEELKGKLEKLRLINIDKSRNQLQVMLSAVPPAREVWLLINEINLSAVRSGMKVANYKGNIGDIREATESAKSASPSAEPEASKNMILNVEYETSGINELGKYLENMEGFLPLVKIVKIDYSLNITKITVEGAWSAWPAPDNDPLSPLNLNTAQIDRQLNDLVGFENLTASSEATF